MKSFERFDAQMRGDGFGNQCSIIGTTAALIGMGVATAAGSVATGAMGAHAAGKAAGAQVDATKYAADKQAEAEANSLAFQKEQFAKEQQNIAPWLEAGKTSLGNLADLMKPGGTLYTTPTFTAPTFADLQNDPAYRFRLEEGAKIRERSAGAKGTVLGGGFQKELERYAQGTASDQYDKMYAQRMDTYNVSRQNQNDLYNRLAGIAGTGQTAANQLNNASQSATNNYTNTVMNSAQNQGNLAVEGGQARASGYINGANARNGAINNGTNNLMELMLINNMKKSGSAGAWI